MNLLTIFLMCVSVIELTIINGIEGGQDIDHTSTQQINGHEVEVNTVGRLASIIYLDAQTSIKKLKCEKNKIILIGKDNLLGRNWTEGQIIVGGAKWECFLNSLDPNQKGIYGAVTHVSFANHHRVNVFIKKTSSLNLFENATISIRSTPAKTNQSGPINQGTSKNDSATSHSVRTLHNRFSKGPFHLIKLKDSADLLQTPDNNNNNSNNISEADKDLSIKVSNCETKSNIAFDMKLVIEQDLEGISHVESFYNQVNVSFKSVVESKTTIFDETAVKKALKGFRQNSQEFLTIPVTVLPGLPSVVLQIYVQPVSSLNLNVFAAHGRSHVTAMVESMADYSAVYEHNKGEGSRQHLKVTDWQLSNQTYVQADVQQDMKMVTQFSHQLKFTAHLGLIMEKIYPLHAFLIQISSNPDVEVESKAAGPVRSTKVISKLSASVATFIIPQPANSTETDVEQQSREKQELNIGEQTLFHLKSAECQCDKAETDQSLKMTDLCAATYSRNSKVKSNFSNLSRLRGNDIVFMSELTNETWCHQQGRKCHGCFRQSLKNSKANQCTDRMVAPSLALQLSTLVLMSKLTWPNRKLIVLKAWTEATTPPPPPPQHHQLSGNNDDSLLYNEGRAIQIGISQPVKDNNQNKMSIDKSSTTLDVLGKLALCSDFPYVRQMKTAGYLEMAICKKGQAEKSDSSSETEDKIFAKKMFMTSMNTTSSNVTVCHDLLAKPFTLGSTFPANMTVDEICGPANVLIDRTNTKDYSNLYEYPFGDIEFKSEGPSNAWCGNTLRSCIDDCNQASTTDELWKWCSKRVMSPRLASRLRELSRLVDNLLRGKKSLQKTPAIRVLMGHKEATENESRSDHFHPLYAEGRGLRITTTSQRLNLNELSLLAICASFDYVFYSDPSFIEVFVKKQAGFVANEVDFLGQSLLVVQPPFSQSQEYAYPKPLLSEPGPSMLFDGSNQMINLSSNFKIQDFLFSDVRYFRLDPLLLMCLERVKQTFPEKFDIPPNGAYRSSTTNLLNLKDRHAEEVHRFQAGKAVELTTKDKDSNILLLLAETVIRQCSPSLRAIELSLGIGLHSSSIYLDLRPQVDKHFIKIWNAGGNNETFRRLKKFSDAAQTGGSLILSSNLKEDCKKPMLGEDFYYLSLHSDGTDFCIDNDKQQDMCKATRIQRKEESMRFMDRLISAAGASAVHTSDIIRDVGECLTDNCGGCPGSGSVWLQKSQACSRLFRTFLNRASNPFPNLHNTVAFYSSTNTYSMVHHLACEQGNICIETIPLYAVIAPLLDSKYKVEESETVEELLYGGEDNPSPLMELLEQELAMRASGKVTVFIETDKDVGVLRNVLKILMVYNDKIDNIEFYISRNVTENKISTSLRRKLDVWSSSTCPQFSRVAITPFSITKIPVEKLRRSVEKSKPRNDRKFSAQNWELDWLNSL